MESEAQPHMEDDITRFKAAGALNETSGPPKSFALFAFPREIRDMIYSELVTSRNIKILRASKTTHEEASISVHQQAICRLNTEISNTGTLHSHSDLSKQVATNIQHLDVQITFPPIIPRDRTYKYHPLPQFGGAEIVRQTCHIRFAIFGNLVIRMDLANALDYLQTLFGYTYVSVRVDIRAPLTQFYIWPRYPYLGHGTPEVLHPLLIGQIKISLETTMGPASVREEPSSSRSYSEDGQGISAPRPFLEFHPRAQAC